MSDKDFTYADYFGQISLLRDLLRDGPQRPRIAEMGLPPERAAHAIAAQFGGRSALASARKD